MTTGTSYFVSFNAAVRYYRPYEPGADLATSQHQVTHKVAAGEIHIGKPPIKPGQKLTIIDDGTRYAITDTE